MRHFLARESVVTLFIATAVVTLEACHKSTHASGKDQIMTDQMTVHEAEQVARKAVMDRLPADQNYSVDVTDNRDAWTFEFLPKGRTRGGGARVLVSKSRMEVVQIVYLQ